MGGGTVIKNAKWSELCKLETLLTFLLPVHTIPYLHSLFLHPFLSYYSQVENGLEEAVEEGQSVPSELRFNITMNHYILYKWILKNFVSLGCALRFAEVILFPFCQVPKLVDLCRVVCVHSYFTLRVTDHYFILSLIHPCLSRPIDFENGSTLLCSSHTSDLFLPVHELQSYDSPRAAKKIIESSHH